MTMEKNGAISRDTPCCGGGCHSKTAGAQEGGQFPQFPETEKQADSLDQDPTKSAIDAVEQASTPKP